MKKSGLNKKASEATTTPAGLTRATTLLRRLRSAAEVTLGHTLTYDELSDYTGEPRSTLGRWFNGDGGPSPEILLRLQELISEKARHDIIDKPPFCRVYPRIDHPSISHDPVATSLLHTISSKATGITLIQGDTDASATFVATAIGHSARMAGGCFTRDILGLDVHNPDWFVPIPGVCYLKPLVTPGTALKDLDVIWPRLVNSKGALVLLNGVFQTVAEAPQKVFQLATKSQIILAAKLPGRGMPITSLPSSVTIITVTSAKVPPERLTLELRVT